jgi:site-specific recombinase XerD
MKITEAFREFHEHYLTVRLYSPETVKGYRWVLHSFIEANGEIETDELGKETVDAWVSFMHKKGLSQSTMVSNLSRFKVFAMFVSQAGWSPIRKNDIFVPKKPKTLPKGIPPEQVDRMLEVCKCIRDKALISFLFSTGVRNTELREMKRTDVDGISVKVNQGKGMRDRVTFMDERTRKLLDIYQMSRVDYCPYLFITSRNTKLPNASLRYILSETSERAGLGRVSPHMFRHGVATHLMENGMPARMIQEFLGHSYLSTTQIYMHVSPDKLKNQHSRILSAKNEGF